MTKKPLFAIFDGTPAHVMVVLGLALALFAPILPRFHAASVARAHAEYEQSVAFADLDLDAFKKQQQKQEDKEDKADRDQKPAVADPNVPDPMAAKVAEHAKRSEAREAALSAKTDELDKTYDQMGKKRVWLEAQGDAAGARAHLILGWLGRALLLLGLMTLTFQSEGTRQKIFLIVLLVALFSSLSGVNLDLTAQGHLGEGTTSVDIPTK
jgi:uncharacterized membrane protein